LNMELMKVRFNRFKSFYFSAWKSWSYSPVIIGQLMWKCINNMLDYENIPSCRLKTFRTLLTAWVRV
jgi:hypothetical protein